VKKNKYMLCWVALLSSIVVHADYQVAQDLVGQEASYALTRDSGRNAWLIKAGQGKTTIESYQADSATYLVKIDYDVNIRLHGPEKGSIEIAIPEAMFTDQFFIDLTTNHPVDFGDFKIDFDGMATVTDAQGNSYEQCYKTRLYDINTGASGGKNRAVPGIRVLRHEGTGILAEIENLVIRLAINSDVSALGAVQVDISGKASGFNIRAGFDLTNAGSSR